MHYLVILRTNSGVHIFNPGIVKSLSSLQSIFAGEFGSSNYLSYSEFTNLKVGWSNYQHLNEPKGGF